MSDGLNSFFMRDPKGFLATYPLALGAEMMGSRGAYAKRSLEVKYPKGCYYFDLEFSGTNPGAVDLRLFFQRVKAHTSKSKEIKAYWLPWKSQAATSMVLEDEADFFFTSALGGCRMQVYNGKKPLVMHVAGDLGADVKGHGGSGVRDRLAAAHEAKKNIGGTASAAARRFSSTKHYSTTQLAFFVGKRYHSFGTGHHWRFFAQAVEVDFLTGKTTIGQLDGSLGSVTEI